MDKDIDFIKETFKLAKKAQGKTSPNPMVGALIVQNNEIIAKGYHKKCGFAHAEIKAIKRAKKKTFNKATLYLNLEPCFSFGRTPPCVDEIIKRKFKQVVIAVKDPNLQTQGKSIQKLKRAGIRVKVGLLSKEAKKLNEVFFKNMQSNLPFVVVKTAQSLDGKIATRDGKSKWITAEPARKFSKLLRDRYDCILVGINTVIKDNPSLDGAKKKLTKVIIDPNLKIPLNSKLLKRDPAKVVIFTIHESRKKAKKLPPATKVFFLKKSNGWLSLKKILKTLYKLGLMSVFIEGGSQTLGRFFDERLVDKAYFFIAPKIIGGRGALTAIGAYGISELKSAPYLENIQFKQIGKDMLISGYPTYRE